MKTINNATNQNLSKTVEVEKALKSQNNFLVGCIVFVTFTYSLLLVLL